MTDDRHITGFLARAGWAGAARTPLSGDASSRRYWRLSGDDRTAILSFSPGAAGRDECARFLRVGNWLAARGYSTPRTIADGSDEGLLLLEDLGDDVFARLLARYPGQEPDLYLATADFLGDLRRHGAPGFVARLDGQALAGLLDVIGEWYLPALGAPTTAAATEIAPMIAALYASLDREQPVLSLRDFHAENLIWLPRRHGLGRIGLLDFQDAVAAHPLYDVVSLLQDARRDVGEETMAAVLDRVLASFGPEQSRFRLLYALLGVQRALRIMGVFGKLVAGQGKPQYLAFLPRVWRHLDRNLAHPELGPLAGVIRAALPAPSTDLINRLKARCGTLTPR